MQFTISVRGKTEDIPILPFLARNYPQVPHADIDSVFGFLERSTLYGGRPFFERQISDADVEKLYSVGIGVRMPLTNSYVEREEYEQNRPLLEKYHRQGNAVIVTVDDLARWIREDFPLYRIEASVIKNINSYDAIYDAFDLYDTVVLPMKFCQDPDFLVKIEHKERITLFANAGCALTCPSKICYPSISKINKYRGDAEFKCSQTLKYRERHGMVDFDLEELQALGFSRFKLLRARPATIAGVRGVTGF
ncbi:MAG TPA: hypothetical protein ENK05_10285 [Gammaproteobacteria bacterium]|nr:hypothetical protein [Gammaproteobacteria bacterium]